MQTPADRTLRWEKLAICIGALAYLIAFNRVLPHGDAMRIVRQIEESTLLWNPNHLLFDPLGYGVYHLLNGFGLTALGSFELLSAISATASLLIFHSILVRAGMVSATARLVAVLALFASSSFLSVSVSQYFFMVQMPFLLIALYCYIDFHLRAQAGDATTARLIAIGVSLAIATTIMFNNLLLVIAMGIAVGLSGHGVKHALWVWLGAAVVGFPAFLIGHALSGTENNLIVWLTSYQGDSASKLNELYGLDWTAAGITQTSAMVGFRLLLANLLETAGLGTVLSIFAFGKPIEFLPQYGKIALSTIAAPVVIVLMVAVIIFTLRKLISEPLVRTLALWIAAYVAFNFLWNVGDEIFWFQMLPAVWLLILMWQGFLANPALRSSALTLLDTPTNPRRLYGLALIAVTLLVINTWNAVLPVSSNAYALNQTRHAALLRAGDLEIFPGWDQQKWLVPAEPVAGVRQLLLMNMAVAPTGSDEEIPKLTAIIANQLQTGGRVIVARVFDLDNDLMPWYALAATGWPRTRIQELLKGFCHRRIDMIDSIVFHELHACPDP